MSWHLHDPNEGEVFYNFDHPPIQSHQRHAKAKALMHPFDIEKIIYILTATIAAAVCLFSFRILSAGVGALYDW